LLNNFHNSDPLSVIARVFLLFQLITVYPLITFMLRSQFFMAVTGNIYPGLPHVLGFNVVVVTVCILFAIFFPSIGTIIRYKTGYDLVLSPIHYACVSCSVQEQHGIVLLSVHTEGGWVCVNICRG
jgi:sodium-coupled neutral amino acid transporter 9